MVGTTVFHFGQCIIHCDVYSQNKLRYFKEEQHPILVLRKKKKENICFRTIFLRFLPINFIFLIFMHIIKYVVASRRYHIMCSCLMHSNKRKRVSKKCAHFVWNFEKDCSF